MNSYIINGIFRSDVLMHAWEPHKTNATFTDIERIISRIYLGSYHLGTALKSLAHEITPTIALDTGITAYEEIVERGILKNRSQVIDATKEYIGYSDDHILLELGLKESNNNSKFAQFLPGADTTWNDDKVFLWALSNITLELSEDRYIMDTEIGWKQTDQFDGFIIDCLIKNKPELEHSKDFYLAGLCNNIFSTANLTLENYMPPEFLIDPEFIRSLARKDLELACHYTGAEYQIGREDLSMIQINKYLSKIDLKDKLNEELPEKSVKDPMTMRDEQASLSNGAARTKSNKLKI